MKRIIWLFKAFARFVVKVPWFVYTLKWENIVIHTILVSAENCFYLWNLINSIFITFYTNACVNKFCYVPIIFIMFLLWHHVYARNIYDMSFLKRHFSFVKFISWFVWRLWWYFFLEVLYILCLKKAFPDVSLIPRWPWFGPKITLCNIICKT